MFAAAVVVTAGGCYRSSPPEMPEFKAPVRAVEEVVEEELVEDKVTLVVGMPDMMPEPDFEPVSAAAPAPVAAAAPPPAPDSAAPTAAAPTIVGSWRVTDMSHDGQSMMMPGMEMTMTFGADGTLTMYATAAEMPEPMTMTGSYTVNGSQITMEMNGDSKSGTFTLTATTLAITVEDVTLALTRA